jgi:hypothetical protein
MADTWRSTAQAVTFASGKSMLDVFNASGSGRILRARRAYQFNNGLGAVTGVLTNMRIYRSTSGSGGSGVTPVAHDTTNTALHANITSGTGRTSGDGDLFRQFIWSNDEPAVAGTTMDEWELLVAFAEVWDGGYGDADVQPVVLRADQGFNIKHQGTTIVGTNDFEIEFTNEAS